MSRENVEIVQRTTDYFNDTGAPGPMELYDPELIFTTRGDVGGAETYKGHRGLVDATASFGEIWTQVTAHIIELLGTTDVVVSVIRFHLRSQAGVDLEVVEAWAYWLRGGKIHRIEQHPTRESALEATGLSE
jgi:ketosteroid isomerase-like protein